MRSASTSAYDGVQPIPTTGRSHSSWIWRAVFPLDAGIAHAPSVSQPAVAAEAAGEQTVPPRHLEHVARHDPACRETARHDLAEDAQVFFRVRADRRIAVVPDDA